MNKYRINQSTHPNFRWWRGSFGFLIQCCICHASVSLFPLLGKTSQFAISSWIEKGGTFLQVVQRSCFLHRQHVMTFRAWRVWTRQTLLQRPCISAMTEILMWSLWSERPHNWMNGVFHRVSSHGCPILQTGNLYQLGKKTCSDVDHWFSWSLVVATTDGIWSTLVEIGWICEHPSQVQWVACWKDCAAKTKSNLRLRRRSEDGTRGRRPCKIISMLFLA